MVSNSLGLFSKKVIVSFTSRIVLDCSRWTDLVNFSSCLWMAIICSLVKSGLFRMLWISTLSNVIMGVLLLLCNGCWGVDGSILKAVCNDGVTFDLLLKKYSHILKYIALLQYCISDCTQTGSNEWYRVVVRENTKMWRGVAQVYIHVALPMYTTYTDMVHSKSTRWSEIIGGHCGHVGLWCRMWFWGIIVDDEGSQQILNSFKTRIRESCGLESNFLF